jgi:hypothetical protein
LAKSPSDIAKNEQQTANQVEALLRHLEKILDTSSVGSDSDSQSLDHRSRMLFATCSNELRSAQTTFEIASSEAQVAHEQATALFEQAKAMKLDVRGRLKTAQQSHRDIQKHATEDVARAEATSLDVLESAIELADSYTGHQQVSTDTVNNWVVDKAGQVASSMISDLESQIVEVGSLDEDIASNLDFIEQNAAKAHRSSRCAPTQTNTSLHP